jgi:hypothetical protein
MDTINVAILKNNSVIKVLVFGPNNSDAEIQTFAENEGGDSFKKLGEFEIVVNGQIVTSESPSEDFIWNTATRSWILPPHLIATIPPDPDEI